MEISPAAPFERVSNSASAFVDVDGDNDPDLFITGGIGLAEIESAKLYFNNGSGTFTQQVGSPFEGVSGGSIGFADVDSDNDQDVLITGRNSGGIKSTKLYINDGNGNFSLMVNTPFDSVAFGSLAFSDVDGDNDPDVLITGRNNSEDLISTLYINDGTGNFSEMTGTPFEGVYVSSIAFADVDRDNDADVLITGAGEEVIAKLYINDGTGTFNEQSGTPFEAVFGGTVAFSDVDGDDDEDVLITGANFGADASGKLYINDGSGIFTKMTGSPLGSTAYNRMAFLDIDGDVDSDILLMGSTGSGVPLVHLYTNDGMANFTRINSYPFEGIENGSISVSDVDGDNDLDVVLTGAIGRLEWPSAKLFINRRWATSVEETLDESNTNFQIYPNPTLDGQLFIEYNSENAKSVEISLMSIEGKIYYRQRETISYGSNKLSVNISTLLEGWYIIKLDNGEQSSYRKLFIR